MPTLSKLPLLAVVATLSIGASRAGASTPDEPAFENRLRIPELLIGERDDDGVVRFELDVRAGWTSFRDGPATATWGVNGTYLGPTLRVERGDEVEVAVHNGVDEPTTMHWHGMHTSAATDGGPYQPIAPGQTWRPTLMIDQPAATLWYHPHPHGATAAHVLRGVAGMVIVDDHQSAALDLPNRYGVNDVPVIIQDRTFDRDNQFRNRGELGDELLVNGTYHPYLDVAHERVRLRVLNASAARFYDLGFADGRSFALIGTDGGLLAAPVTVEHVQLSPGERAEIVVDVEPGEHAVLRSSGADSSWGSDTFDVLELHAAEHLISSPPVPASLADVERLDPTDAAATRTFRLSGTQVNGRHMDMNRIDFAVTAGTSEIWEVINEAGAHNFHVHGVSFQVLDVDGAPAPANLGGWKDTVAIRAGSTVRLIIPFGADADPGVPYMFHCHKLRHEDLGMMGQFVLVADGESAADAPADHDH